MPPAAWPRADTRLQPQGWARPYVSLLLLLLRWALYVCVHTRVFSHSQGMTHASVRVCVCALTHEPGSQWELVQGVCGDGTLGPLGTRGSMITWAWAPELAYGLVLRGSRAQLYPKCFLRLCPCYSPTQSLHHVAQHPKLCSQEASKKDGETIFLLYLPLWFS